MSSRGWILFLAMSIIWGIPYLLIKIAVEGVSVPVLVFTRVAVGAAVLLPLALSRRTVTIVRDHWKALAGFAFFEIIAAWWLLSDAERHLTSSMTGLLIAAAPIIAAVLDRLTGGERLGAKRILGLAIGIAGVAVLAGPHIGGSTWPIIEVLLVATCYAIAPLIAARHLADVPALPDDGGVSRIRRVGVCSARRRDLARRNALHPSAFGARRTRRHLHSAGVSGVLRPDPRGRRGSRAGLHLRQPGRGA